MPIRYYEGIEGSGKTSMMTRDLLNHHRAGGQVLAFPGYELKEDDGTVVSRPLPPEEWVSLPEDLKNKLIAIAIDEVKNWFNNHNWYNKMIAMMASLMEQRRKFSIAVLMTGPIFYRLPPEIQELVHEIVHCEDQHFRNHSISAGERCVYYKEDRRGMFSERFPMVRFTRKKVFYMKAYRENFDTYQAVDPMNQFIKIKIQAREIIIGPDGKPISRDNAGFAPSDSATLDRFINEYKEKQSITDPYVQHVGEVLKRFESTGLKRVKSSLIYQILKVTNNSGKWKAGNILKGIYKCTYQKTSAEYILPKELPTVQLSTKEQI